MKVGEIFNPHKMFDGIWIIDPMKRSKLISPGAKICYGQLKRYAGKNGEAFPSHEKLADEIGVRARMVRNYITELKDNGFLIVERTRTVNHYKFVWHEIFEESIKVIQDDTRQDVATTPGKMLPPHPARCCHPGETEKPLPGIDESGENERLRESINENNKEREQQEPAAPPVSSNSKEKGAVKEAISYLHNLYREKFNIEYPVTRGTDHGILKNLINEHGLDNVREILKLHINTKDDWVIERGCSLTTIKNSLPEYLVTINKASADAERKKLHQEEHRRRMEEEKLKDEEIARERAAYEALSDLEKAQHDLIKFQENIKPLKEMFRDGESADRLEKYEARERELMQRITELQEPEVIAV